MPTISIMNEKYFQRWSNNMAYILGFITADGSVTDKNHEYRLRIASKDREIMEFIRNELEYIHEVKLQLDGCYMITISRKQIVMDLMSMGILPRKSWSPLVPDVPNEYRVNFIHGLFDGDGSVWSYRDAKKSLILLSNICSYSKEFLQIIGDQIKDEIGAIPKIYSGKTHIYRLMYATYETVGIYHMLYDNKSISDMYLHRKRDVFERWLVDYKNDINWGLRPCKLCGAKFIAFADKSYRCWACRRNNRDIVRTTAESVDNIIRDANDIRSQISIP